MDVSYNHLSIKWISSNIDFPKRLYKAVILMINYSPLPSEPIESITGCYALG